jgi:septum formation protein
LPPANVLAAGRSGLPDRLAPGATNNKNDGKPGLLLFFSRTEDVTLGEPELILASTSIFRSDLLKRLRIPFRVAAPSYSEVSPAEPVTPETVRTAVLENAVGKGLSVAAAHPRALILASDQLGECEGRLLAKPGTPERALEQLSRLSGKEHRLHTAVVLVRAETGERSGEVITNTLRMRALPESALRRYLELEDARFCAGSYISEGLGVALFESLGGDDPTAVIGLPLIATTRLLEAAGISVLGREAA